MKLKRYDPFQDKRGFGMKECLMGDYVLYEELLSKSIKPHQRDLFDEICKRYIGNQEYQDKTQMVLDIGIMIGIISDFIRATQPECNAETSSDNTEGPDAA